MKNNDVKVSNYLYVTRKEKNKEKIVLVADINLNK